MKASEIKLDAMQALYADQFEARLERAGVTKHSMPWVHAMSICVLIESIVDGDNGAECDSILKHALQLAKLAPCS
jgi:hypothetical protein